MLTQVTTGTDLEDIKFRELSPSQKERNCRSTYEVPGVIVFSGNSEVTRLRD